MNKLITIICPLHGEFLQSSGAHVQGAGCKKCAIERTRAHNILTLDKFKERVQKLYGEGYIFYDIPSEYKGRLSFVNMKCHKHGIILGLDRPEYFYLPHDIKREYPEEDEI
jgi:hypothetical protein